MRPIRVLSERDVREIFTLDLALTSQRRAFAALGTGEAIVPARLLVEGAAESVAFCYAARLGRNGGAVSKFGSVNPGNVEHPGLPAVNAVVLVLDPATGVPIALMDGTSVTEIRTAAASAVAAETIAPTAQRVLVVGTGVQAAAHVRALQRTHPGAELALWGRQSEAAGTVSKQLSAELDTTVSVPRDLAAATAAADLVVLCTSSTTPVIEDEWVTAGATVISIGSFAPDRHELPQPLVRRAARIAVDHRASAVTDAGPIATAVAAGAVRAEEIIELGEVIVTGAPLVRAADEIVYYNSVGLGAQDAAAAEVIAGAAAAGPGVGTVIDLG